MKKVKAMPQLMEPHEQQSEINFLYDVSLGKGAYQEYSPYDDNTRFAFKVGNYDVYVQDEYPNYTFLCFNNKEPNISDKIIFNSILRNVEPRNNMFRDTGLCQSLIIKENKLTYPNFGKEFLLNLLEYGYIDTFLASDLLQSSFGASLWEKLLYECKKRGYFCFFSMSAPKFPKFVIFLKSPKDALYYKKYITGTSSGYRTRTAVIVQKGAKIENILKKNDNIYYVSCEKAQEMGFFEKPRDLTDDEIALFSKIR